MHACVCVCFFTRVHCTFVYTLSLHMKTAQMHAFAGISLREQVAHMRSKCVGFPADRDCTQIHLC